MPKGHQDTKYIPNHKGAEGNLPPAGQGPPGVYSGGTKPTGKPNANGAMSGGKSSGKGSAKQASKPPMGNAYKAPHNPY